MSSLSVKTTADFFDDVCDLVEALLRHFQAYLIVLILLAELIVAKKHTEGLPSDHVTEPEKQVVCIARYYTLELSLEYHGGYVDHHA